MGSSILSQNERKQLALTLARDIRTWNSIAKHAHNANSRARAYAVKHRMISNAILRFGDFFRVSSVEFHTPQGTRVLVRFPIRRASVHAPLASLAEEAQERIRQNILSKI